MGFKYFKVGLQLLAGTSFNRLGNFHGHFYICFLAQSPELFALRYLQRSVVSWNGWNGSPGQEGNGALVPAAASFPPPPTPARASPASRVQGNCIAGKVAGDAAAAAYSICTF